MTPRKQITQPAPEVLPAKQEGTTVVSQAPGLPTLTFIVASDTVRRNVVSKAAHLVAEAGTANAVGERKNEQACQEYLRLRRMHPAVESIRAILGDDTPDLAGKSDAYKADKAALEEQARDEMINKLRKEGFTIKLATAQADAEMERIRKSVTRFIRIAVEDEAKAIRDSQGREAAVKFVLANGFGYSGEVTNKSYAGIVESKEWKLDKDGNVTLPEGLTFSENGRDVVKAVQQLEPAEQSSNVPTAETLQAELLQLAQEQASALTSVVGNLTASVEGIDRAAGLLHPDTPETVANIQAAHKALVDALRSFERRAKVVIPMMLKRESWTDEQRAEYAAYQKALEALKPGELAPNAPAFVTA